MPTGDYDGDGIDDGPCWTDNSTYFYFSWEGGCTATNINYSGGDLDLSSYGFTESFFFYGFEDNTTETFTMSFNDGTSATSTASTGTCSSEGCSDGYLEDCSGDGDCCLESWIGDGYPDCADQQYGCDLTCYDNDGGDCDGRMSEVSLAPIEKMYMYTTVSNDIHNNVSRDFNNSSKYFNYLSKLLESHMLINSLTETQNKEYFHNQYNNRDLIGYNVLRDGSEIGFTENTSYDDSNVTPGVEYCYTVVAVYEEGEASPSNEDCAIATSPPNPVGLSVSDESVSIGESGLIEISMNNNDPVAGFQFTLSMSPDIGDVINVTTTDRTDGFNVSTNNGIIVGFSLTGDIIDPGTGPIVNVEVVGTNAGSANTCLNDIVISDPSGQAMNPNASCGTFMVTEEPVDAVVLSVGDGSAQLGDTGSLSIGMENNESVGGFQFNIGLDTPNATIVDVLTTDRTANFTVSQANGIVVGFSLTGDVVQPGTGPILDVVMEGLSGGTSVVCLSSIVLSDPMGNGMPSESNCGSFTVSTGPVFGCTDEEACNYDSLATNDDGSCEYPEENYDCDGNCSEDVDCNGDCAGSAELDECGVCEGNNSSCSGCTDSEALNYDEAATIDDGSCIYNEPEYFVVDINDTGESSLIIIQSALDLEEGDEIGLFDAMGVVESCIPDDGCDDIVMGEVLVGSGVWTGEQLEIVGIGSVDLSEFGGPTLAGYTSGNPIHIKVWKSSENAVYDAVASYSVGNGNWGAILTAIDVLEPVFSIVQTLAMDPYQTNMVSLNVEPEDATVSFLLNDLDVLLVSNDASDYYVPSFGVDQIGSFSSSEAFNCFLNGASEQAVEVEGLPIDPSLMMIELEPFTMNLCRL